MAIPEVPALTHYTGKAARKGQAVADSELGPRAWRSATTHDLAEMPQFVLDLLRRGNGPGDLLTK